MKETTLDLKKILDERYRKLLKLSGLYVSDRMTEEDMEVFYKEIWLVDLPLDIINDVLEQIDNYISKKV